MATTPKSAGLFIVPKEIKIPLASVTKDLTVNVRLEGFRRWHLRLRVGMALMRFAVWVSGMGFEVEDSEPLELPDPNRPSAEALEQMMAPRFIGGEDKEKPDNGNDATNDERYGDDSLLTERGKETIGMLRQIRAKGYPRSRCRQFLDHEIGKYHAQRSD